MPVIIALALLFFPRLFVAYLYFFTGWFAASHLALISIILGVIFAPLSLLWYSAVMVWFGGTWGVMQIVVMVAALLIDFGGGFGALRRRG